MKPSAIIILAVLLFVSCTSGIDKRKFEGIKSAASALNKAEKEDPFAYEKFEAGVQKFAAEIETAKAVVNTPKEKGLLSEYEELLVTYREGADLWKYRLGSSQYDWIPQGRIYVDEKVSPIALKYRIATQSHVIDLTDHRFESIPADSIKKIWEKAGEQYKKIRTPLF
jgi:hypothetical protein